MANFGKIKTGVDLAEAALEVAKNYKTLYITGCFGWPMTPSNKTRIKNEWEANRKPPRSTNIDNASSDTFGFDCVNLLKALLWGWCGDKNAPYGGVKYASNGVPDVDEGTMFYYCTNKSSDFNNIEIGEACWMQGHIGVYVGNGLCVECTPAWSNNVQITSCNRTIAGYNRRDWTQHGKLPYVTYTGKNDETIKPSSTPTSKRELHLGDKGEDVKQLQKDLIELGYDLGIWGADGDFGNDTDKAVRAFQKNNGLDVDGWVGKNTYAAIEKALEEKRKPVAETRPFKVGDEVKLKLGAKYTSGKEPKSWVYTSKLYVRELQANGTVVISTLATGAVTGIVYEKDLEFYNIPEKTVNYLVTVTANLLNVRMAPSDTAAIQTQIKKGGYYTVVKERGDWLQFKSGGWVMAKHVKKV